MKFNFDTQMLDYVQMIHDNSGPRCALAFYMGRDDYMSNTKDLETALVEDFSIAFYTAYNKENGTRY